MRFVKFNDIYINVDSIVAIEPSLMFEGRTLIYTNGGSSFSVDGDLNSVMRVIFEGGSDRYEILSKQGSDDYYCPFCGRKLV